MAVTCFNLKDYPRALDAMGKVYAIRCRVLGEEHPDTRTAFRNLEAIRSKLGV